jgi:hypothetical protein
MRGDIRDREENETEKNMSASAASGRASSSSSSPSAAAGGASREELLALLAARDAQLAARDAQLAELLAARAADEARRRAAVAAAEAERDAAVAAAEAARDAACASAGAERAFARSLLARDATLAAALAERDERRRLMERPSVRAALLGERLLDVLPIVAAVGFAAEVSHCLYLCGETWRKGDKGATNDMLARSLERQCGASAARAARREGFVHPTDGWTLRGSTQLIRAAALNNLPRVLQLVQLGAPLKLEDNSHRGCSALHWACEHGHEHVARALLDGKCEGRGAEVDARDKTGWTPLMMASQKGHEGVVRLLLARGARPELQDNGGWTALHLAVQYDHAGTVALLCAAPGAAAALLLRYYGKTPLSYAIARGHAACEAVLRAHGARE